MPKNTLHKRFNVDGTDFTEEDKLRLLQVRTGWPEKKARLYFNEHPNGTNIIISTNWGVHLGCLKKCKNEIEVTESEVQVDIN